MAKSLYIHIPFCRKKCIYCDFYSIAYNKALASDYAEALVAHFSSIKGVFDTVFIGGGTPSILDIDQWQMLLKNISTRLNPDCEFTVEANPDSLQLDKLKIFLEYGVNRISIGVQSFDDKKLKKLGRIHDGRAAENAIRSAYDAGFKNISCDLMFGVWGETLDQWQHDLRLALSLPVNHISAYALSCEDSTPLAKDVELNRIEMMNENEQAELYSFTMQALPLAGFAHYEVSNYARPGFECRHNMVYWRNEDYLGIGAGAAGYVDKLRYKNIENVKEYIKNIKNKNNVIAYSESLNEQERARETAAIKIRTQEGIKFEWYKQATGFDFHQIYPKVLDDFISMGLIVENQEGIHLTNRGFLFADDVSSRLV